MCSWFQTRLEKLGQHGKMVVRSLQVFVGIRNYNESVCKHLALEFLELLLGSRGKSDS
jgi:hypothetical protein